MIARIVNFGNEPEIHDEVEYDLAFKILVEMFDKGWLHPTAFTRDDLIKLLENKNVQKV